MNLILQEWSLVHHWQRCIAVCVFFWQMSAVSPVGTLAFVVEEEALLVRVEAGWQYVAVSEAIKDLTISLLSVYTFSAEFCQVHNGSVNCSDRHASASISVHFQLNSAKYIMVVWSVMIGIFQLPLVYIFSWVPFFMIRQCNMLEWVIFSLHCIILSAKPCLGGRGGVSSWNT